MFDYVQAAVEGALAAGATFADARAMELREEQIEVQNQQVQQLDRTDRAGVGVRALIGSSWGFFATDDISHKGAQNAGDRAAEIARASAAVPGDPVAFAEVPAVEDSYLTPVEEDPFSVGTSEKVDLLVAVTKRATDVAEVKIAEALMKFGKTDKWYVNSQGCRIYQRLVQSGGGFTATAVGENELQLRSYPQWLGQYEAGGYEVIRRWDYLGNVERVASEAAALLHADELTQRNTNLILEGSQVAIHESVGHGVELDRILGWEAAFAGRSHLELAKLGEHRYGSPLMNVTADATLPGAVGTFGYDDEGTRAQRIDIVSQGTWAGVLSGRDSAAIAGLPPGGMVRGDGYNRLPMIRMTNVGLLPGDSSLDEMIADTDDGVYMATNRSWSIDDKRLNFQFGCEIGWEVKNGKLHRMVKNPTYTGITPIFWGNLDRLAGEADLVHWGLATCGKGQPMQVAPTGHSAATARFVDTRVGVSG